MQENTQDPTHNNNSTSWSCSGASSSFSPISSPSASSPPEPNKPTPKTDPNHLFSLFTPPPQDSPGSAQGSDVKDQDAQAQEDAGADNKATLDNPPLSYREMFDRVEEIIAGMQHDTLDIDIMITEVRRGHEYIKKMRQRLAESENTITEMKNELLGEGSPQRPYSGDPSDE